jgi:hypothetical protein
MVVAGTAAAAATVAVAVVTGSDLRVSDRGSRPGASRQRNPHILLRNLLL